MENILYAQVGFFLGRVEWPFYRLIRNVLCGIKMKNHCPRFEVPPLIVTEFNL